MNAVKKDVGGCLSYQKQHLSVKFCNIIWFCLNLLLKTIRVDNILLGREEEKRKNSSPLLLLYNPVSVLESRIITMLGTANVTHFKVQKTISIWPQIICLDSYLGSCGPGLGRPLCRRRCHSRTWRGRAGRRSAGIVCRVAGASWAETQPPGHFATPRKDPPMPPAPGRPDPPAARTPPHRCSADGRGEAHGAVASCHRCLSLRRLHFLPRSSWPRRAPL